MKYLILIPGINDDGHIFHKMVKSLRGIKYKVMICEITPSDGSLTIRKMAEQLADYINKQTLKKDEIVLIGFSMGGIIAKYYLQKIKKLRSVTKLITISSPHHGTYLAYLKNLPAAKQMRPKSRLLKELDKPLAIKEYTIHTPLDLMIFPSVSSKVATAKNYSVISLAHPLMPSSSKVIGLIKKILN